MKQFLKKQREAIAILVFIAVVAVLVYFVIIPLISRINSISDNIQENVLRQEISEKKLDELPEMEEQYEVLLKEEEKIDVLLDRDKVVVLIEKLEKLAQDSGNNITISIKDSLKNSSQLQIAQKRAGYSAVSKELKTEIMDNLPSSDYLQMEIIIIGNYETIMNFINTIENFEYYCDIVSFKIGQEDQNAEREIKNDLFAPAVENDDNKEENSLENRKIEASLDVVFYTKN